MQLAQSSATAQTTVQSFPSPVRSQASGSAAANELNKRRELALDAAVIAARGKLFDLSIEAVRRATEQPVVIAKPEFQSTLLGGQPTGSSINLSAGPARGERSEQTAMRQKLELLVDVWKEMEAPPEKIAALLQDIVLPGDKGQMIQMFAARPASAAYQSSSFDMAAKLAPPARVLGFELIDWAHAAGKLDDLITVLENRAADPISQTAANALLLYAHRVAGNSEGVTKTLENLLAKTSRAGGESNLGIVALTRSVPEGVQDDALDESAVADFALRLLQVDPDNMEIRAYAMQRLATAIEQGDRAQVKRITEAIESSIDALNVNGDQYKTQLKTSFWSSAERECIRKGQADLIIDFVLRQNTADQAMNRYSGMEHDRLIALADGSSELRMERARRLLLETPLAGPNQLTFVTSASIHVPPQFFRIRDSVEAILPHVVPFEGAKTISLLDMLLNEAEARGESQTIVEQLFKNASDRDDVIKLIAQWLMLRAEKRGKQVDEKIAARGRFETEQDFIDWVKRMPPVAASELLSQHIAKRPLSSELADLFAHRESSGMNMVLWNVEGFAEKLYRRKNPSAPPLRSLGQLKHWCIASSLPSRQSSNYRTILEVSGTTGKQALGDQGGTLVLRYPVTGEVTVQGTFKSSNLDMTTLGLHGIAVRLSNNATVLLGHHGISAGSAIPLDDSSKIAWSLNKDTLSLSVNGELKRKWRQNAAGSPFVSLVSPFLLGTVPDDFSMTGKVEIPRQVELIDPGLTGWSSRDFYHTLPQSNLAFEEIPVGNAQNNRVVYPTSNAGTLIWRVDKGEIAVGRSRADSAGESLSSTSTLVYSSNGALNVFTTVSRGEVLKTRQTEIHYDRPLLEGERIEFELFHDSGAQTAAPVTGRLAYCLEGEKVALHWIATEAELKRFNLPEENRADDPAGEQLAPVKLEDHAWNRLALRIESGKVVLSIADQDVYRRPLAKDESTLFGFFADPSAPETRIRNVVLKGDWPSELPKDLWELTD